MKKINWQWPSMTEGEKQTSALLMLFLGEIALTACWVGLYVFEFIMHENFKEHSGLAATGQGIIWKLMAIHAMAIVSIAIGNIVSARVGDWFEIKRFNAESKASVAAVEAVSTAAITEAIIDSPDIGGK